DGVGAAVVDALGEHGIDAVAFDGDGTELMDAWQDCDAAILIDAMSSGAAPGTVRRFDLSEETLHQDEWRSSSHTFGLVQAAEIARVLDRLPARMIVFGIEGERFEYGERVSPSVQASVAGVVDRIKAELSL
ncbi:hydrogenase maturation protease, partial [Pseudomonadota bacterium]